MKYRQLRRALCIPALLCTMCMARGADPSDLFLQAYQDFEAAEKLEVNGSNPDALAKYKEAEQLLGQVKQAAGDWQPLVVAYRLKKTEESIQRLQAQGVTPGAATVETGGGDNTGVTPAVHTTAPATTSDNQAAFPSVSSDPLSPAAEQGPAKTTLMPSSGPGEDSNLSVGANILMEREMYQMRKQMSALKRQNAALTEKLQNQSALVQSKGVEVDRTKVQMVELKSEIAQVKDAYDNLLKDGKSSAGSFAAYEARIKELQAAVDAGEADKEVLQDENNQLDAKLDKASRYIKAGNDIRKGLETDRETLATERDKAVAKAKHIKDNSAQMQRMTADDEKIKDQNTDLKKQVTDLKKNGVSRDDYNKMVAMNNQLAEQNKDLTTQLATANKMAGNSDADQKRISQLETDLDGTKDRLLETQADVSKGEERINQLMKQLDETSGELAQLKLNPSPSNDDKKMISENELLRDIVLREIKEQAKRDAAGKEVEKQAQDLKINSEPFSQQLSILEEPVQLTPEEQALFKEPVTLLDDSKASSMEISTAIAKPKPGASPAQETAAASPSQTPDQDSLPESVKPLVQKAHDSFDKGDFTTAEKNYQSIVDAAPDSYFALSNLGAVQIQSGKLAAAEVALKKALGVNADNYFAYLNLGIVYCKQGKFGDAIDTLNHAITLNDTNSVAHNYLGICEGEKGDKASAEKEFKRAVDLNPNYGEAHFNLAVLYATSQPPSLQEAKEHYTKAVSLGAAPDPSLEALINKS